MIMSSIKEVKKLKEVKDIKKKDQISMTIKILLKD